MRRKVYNFVPKIKNQSTILYFAQFNATLILMNVWSKIFLPMLNNLEGIRL